MNVSSSVPSLVKVLIQTQLISLHVISNAKGMAISPSPFPSPLEGEGWGGGEHVNLFNALVLVPQERKKTTIDHWVLIIGH
jgi:hypothetical protein